MLTLYLLVLYADCRMLHGLTTVQATLKRRCRRLKGGHGAYSKQCSTLTQASSADPAYGTGVSRVIVWVPGKLDLDPSFETGAAWGTVCSMDSTEQSHHV